MVNDEKALNNEPWWKPGIELFSQVSVWIVTPIVLALIIGKSLDNYFGTKPVIFLTLTGLGFIFTCIGMVRVIRKYLNKLKEIEQEKSDK